MKLSLRDGIATVLVAAIVVPYIGYVAQGSMPFIQDPTGMAGVGLGLGLVAALIGGWVSGRAHTLLQFATLGLVAASAGLGITALVSEHLLDGVARDGVLAGFIATIVALWAWTTLRHAGMAAAGEEPTSRLGRA